MVKLLNRGLIVQIFGIRLPHWAITILWMLGIVAMSSLTVKDLRPIIDNYYNDEENTQVQIKIRRPDEYVQAPDLFACFELPVSRTMNFTRSLLDYLKYGRKCSQCEQMTSHSYDVWNRVTPRGGNETFGDTLASMLNVDEVMAEVERAFIQRTLELGLNSGITKLENLPWTRPIIDSIVEYSRKATEMETSIFDRLRSPTNFTRDRPTNARDLHLSLEKIDDLYTIFTTFMCDSIQVGTNTNPNWFDCAKFMRASSLILSNQSFLCTRVPLEDEEVVELLFFSIALYFDTTIESIDYLSAEKRFLLTTENPSYRSSISSLPIAKLYETQDAELGLDQVVTITYSLQSSVDEQRPGKLKACYNESSGAECELRCWNERMESVCGCQSYVYRNRSLSTPTETRSISDGDIAYCTPKDLHTCSETIQHLTASYDCSKKCSVPCHSFAYQWQVSSGISKVARYVPLELNIQLRRQSYLEFIMKVKDTSEDLVSQIGGVFNFYMGLSGLSLIFITIYIFESVLRYFELRRGGGEVLGPQASVPSAPLQQRWAQVTAVASIVARNTTSSPNESDQTKEISAMNVRLEAIDKTTEEKLELLDRKIDLGIGALHTSINNMAESAANLSQMIRNIQDVLDGKRKHVWNRK